MRTLILASLFLFIVGEEIFSQTFQKYYSSGNNEASHYFLEVDGGYFLVNAVFAGLHNAEIIKVDGNGDSLWQKYVDSGILNSGINQISPTFNGDFVFAWTKNDTSNHDSISVYTLDNQGNIILRFTVTDTIPVGFQNIIQTSDSGFLLAGSYWQDYGNFQSDIYIYKTDAAGNVLWRRIMFPWQQEPENVIDVTETDDHGFAVLIYSDVCCIHAGDVSVLKLDSAGNLMNMFGENAFPPGSANSMIEKDGDIIYFELLDSADFNTRIIRLDPSCNLVWKKTMSAGYPRYNSISDCQSGGFYLAGSTDDSNYQTVVTKFDDNGDSLYSYYYSSSAHNLVPLYVSELSGGRIAITGEETTPVVGNGNPRRAFFIIADSSGIILSSSPSIIKSEDAFFGFPNPVHDVLKINGLKTAAAVSIYTMTGRLVRNDMIVDGKLSFSNLEAGVYFIKFTEDEIPCMMKVLKN